MTEVTRVHPTRHEPPLAASGGRDEPPAQGVVARLVRRQRDLAVALNGTTDLNEALHRCLGVAIEVSGMDSGGVYLVERETGALRLAASVGLSDDFVAAVRDCAPPQFRSERVMKGEPLYISQAAASVDMDALLRAEGVLIAAAIPVRHGGEVIASLNVASHSVARVSRVRRAALEATAAQIGAAIARIRAEQDRQEVQRRLSDLNASLERQVAERTAAAVEAAEQLRDLVDELSRVEQRERRRVGQLLHDDVQQLLVAARIRLRWLARQPASERSFDDVDELLKQSLAVCRSLSGRLSPPAEEGGGLDASLRWLAAWMRDNHRLDVTLRLDLSGVHVDETLHGIVFSAARELLFNVVKHAGTDKAELRLTPKDGGRLRLAVVDHGVGWTVSAAREGGPSGLGLPALTDRVRQYGGDLTVERTPGGGSCVAIELPSQVADQPSA